MSNQQQPSETLTARLRQFFKPAVDAVAGVLIKLGIGPNALTVFGFLVATGGAVLAARGQFLWAALALIVGTPLDAADGAVARLSGRVSKFGALLDSTLDRYGEAALLTGLGWYMMTQGMWTGVALAFTALFGSVMVSYVRARTEGLGGSNKVGLMTRVERIAVQVLMLLSGQVLIGLWVLAILTHVTVGQRVWEAHRTLRDEPGDE